MLTVPVVIDGKTQQIDIRCARWRTRRHPGHPAHQEETGNGSRMPTMTLKQPKPTQDQGVMGVDLGIKVPAVSYVAGKDRAFMQWAVPAIYAPPLLCPSQGSPKAGKKRALRKSQGKEQRWMKNSNHLLSHQIVHQHNTMALEQSH